MSVCFLYNPINCKILEKPIKDMFWKRIRFTELGNIFI